MTSLNVPLNNSIELSAPPSLRFENVEFNPFGHRLFGPCSFTLDGPGPTLVMGPNGAGKSLMLRLAHGLARFGLSSCADTPARVLSGGEKQRLALARAWSLSPAVLFLDEPTSALDPAAIKAVEAAVQEFHKQGTRVVMTTHDLHQARRLAGDVLFLSEGKVQEHTSADIFFRAPVSRHAQAYLNGELVA